MFTLPVPTPALVFWPMLQAAAAVALLWVAWVGAVLRTAGLDLPLVWPALLVANVAVWLQAAAWVPYPLPFMRLGAVLLATGLVGLWTAYGWAWEVPQVVWVGGLAALLPTAYGVAVAGVARARRGDTPEWTWPGRVVRAVAAWLPRRRAAFRSPLEAHAWLEWRVRGIGFPFMIGFFLLGWVPLLVMGERAIADLVAADTTPALAAAVGALTPPGYLLAVVLATPLFVAVIAGNDMGGLSSVGQRSPAPGCHPFIALRPLTDWELILAKYRMAARATLTGWAMVLTVVVPWLVLTGKWRVLAGAPVFRSAGAVEVGAGLTAALAGLMLLTWVLMVSGFWIGLTGRPWLIHTVGVAGSMAWLPLTLLAVWLSDYPAVVAALWAALPAVAVGAVVLKLLLAGWLARAVWRRGLMSRRGLALAAGGWMVAAVGFLAVARWLVPADRVALAWLAVGVALVVPLNRFVAAPLALAWNRHR
jgi:hypothetical protein